MELEKERTAGGEEKRETTPSVDTATPDVWNRRKCRPASWGRWEKWNSICPIFNMFFVRILISL